MVFGPFGLYQILLLGPGIVVMACTACRVHRLMVSAYHDPAGGDVLDFPPSRVLTSIRFARTHPAAENTLSRLTRPENLAGAPMNNSSGDIVEKNKGSTAC